jgi:thimet oligopeptidase
MRELHPDPRVRDTALECLVRTNRWIEPWQLDQRLAALEGPLDRVSELVVTHLRRMSRHAGVGMDAASVSRLQDARANENKAARQYGRRVLETVKTVSVSAADLAGVPEALAREWLGDGGGDGKVVAVPATYQNTFTVLERARSREIRKQFYLAYSAAGDETIADLRAMLIGRQEQARVFGFPTYADYLLDNSMVGNAKAAANFLEEIAGWVKERARYDHREMAEFRRAEKLPEEVAGVGDVIDQYDWYYLRNLMEQRRHGVGARLEEYFSYQDVEAGARLVTSKLFGIEYRDAPGVVTWHPDVRVLDVWEPGQGRIGRVYVDVFPRTGKSVDREAVSVLFPGVLGQQLPVLILEAEYPRRDGMSRDQVRGLFHEFGHLAGALSNRRKYRELDNWEQDFSEVDGDLLGEFAFHPKIVPLYAKHLGTRAPMPTQLVQELQELELLGEGQRLQSDLYRAALFLQFHILDAATFDIAGEAKKLKQRYSLFPYVNNTLPSERDLVSGTSLTQYRYLLAEMIAKDLFAEFARDGVLSAKVGKRFRETVLEPVGLASAKERLEKFLGRPSRSDAFKAYLQLEPGR